MIQATNAFGGFMIDDPGIPEQNSDAFVRPLPADPVRDAEGFAAAPGVPEQRSDAFEVPLPPDPIGGADSFAAPDPGVPEGNSDAFAVPLPPDPVRDADSFAAPDPGVPEQRSDAFVRPLPPDPVRDADPFAAVDRGGEVAQMTPWEPEPPRDRSKLWVGGAVIGVVVIAAIAGAVWFRNLVGDPLGSLRSVPPAAQVVVTIDGLQLLDFDDYQRLVDVFADPAGEPGVIEEDANILDTLDEAFEDEFGIGFRDGVLPWVGRTASIAAWDVDPRNQQPSFLVAVDVRDAAKAADFLDTFADALADDQGTVVEVQSVVGRSVVFVSGGEFGTDMFGTVLEDVMLMAGSADALERGIAARAGESVADRASYADAIAKLPSDRVVTAFFDPSLIDSLSSMYGGMVGGGFDTALPEGAAGDLEAMAASFTLAEEGLQFDAVQVYAEAAAVPLGTLGSVDLVDRLPADTLAYLAIPFSATDIEMAIASIEDVFGAEFDAMAEEVEAQFGIDLIGDLLPTLDRGFVFAGYGTQEGELARNFAPFGLMGAVGLNDPQPVKDALAVLDDLMAQEMDTGFERIGDLRIVRTGIDPTIAWGVGADVVAAASSVTELEAMLAGVKGGVVEAGLYADLDAALPGDGLLLYVDIPSIVELIGMDPATLRSMAPLRGVGASADISGNTASARLLVLIDY